MPEIIAHRKNKISELAKLPRNFGVEIDIRTYKNKLILNHEPFLKGDSFEDYLQNYNNGTMVVNIKEAGIEDIVIKTLLKYKIKKYFLLDVEMPYIYKSFIENNKNIAIRYSEVEEINLCKIFKNKFNWVWIDTFTKLPIKKKDIDILNNFKKCLVCPERWGRPEDIKIYKKKLKKLNFKIDAVMTSVELAEEWSS